MTEEAGLTYGDPITAPFWQAAAQRRLIIQRCGACGAHQFYPRPFCLQCDSGLVEWVEAAGTATIYSLTTVRLPVSPEFHPPYRVAVVQLDEGPRMLTNIIGGECGIGERVRVQWRERAGAPPLPVFEPMVTEPGPQQPNQRNPEGRTQTRSCHVACGHSYGNRARKQA